MINKLMKKFAVIRLLLVMLSLPLLSAVTFAAPPYGMPKEDKSAGGTAKAPAQQVRFDLTLSRVDGGTPAAGAASPAVSPTILGSPTLTTFDRNTASLSVT